jgi:leucyl-tRNA synthetase
LEKIYKLVLSKQPAPKSDDSLKSLLHKTIKKVAEDIDAIKFNTAVSAFMEFTNAWQISKEGLEKKDIEIFLKILSPLAPHLSEELWSLSGMDNFCCEQKWPVYDTRLMEKEKVLLIVQINGKVRDKIEISPGISQKEASKLALNSEKIKVLLGGTPPKKIIFVPDKLINIVI